MQDQVLFYEYREKKMQETLVQAHYRYLNQGMYVVLYKRMTDGQWRIQNKK